MMDLGTILKVLGVKIPPETIKQIEAMAPQIPGRVVQAIAVINSFDARLARMEEALERIEVYVGSSDDINRPAGVGATQRALAAGEFGPVPTGDGSSH